MRVTVLPVLSVRCRILAMKSQTIDVAAVTATEHAPGLGLLQQHNIPLGSPTFSAISRPCLSFAARFQPIFQQPWNSSQSRLGEHIMLPAPACNPLSLKENLAPTV